MEENTICKNCAAPLQGAFCHECGQKANTQKLTIRVVFDNLFYGMFGGDKNIFRTLYALFTRPGTVMSEYIAGHRVKYFNPFTMLIILSGIVGIVSGLFTSDEKLWTENFINVDLGTIANPFLRRLANVLIKMVQNNTAFLTVITLPFYALATKWAVGKKSGNHYNYTELLYINTYILCQWVVLSSVLQPLLMLVFQQEEKTGAIMLSILAAQLFMLMWNYKQLFRLSAVKAAWKALLMYLYWFLIILAIGIVVGFTTVIAAN